MYMNKYKKYYSFLMLSLFNLLFSGIKTIKSIVEELCAKGKAYRKRRMAAGEKSSAYLSGRAVKVCKGQIRGTDKKQRKDFRPGKGKTRSAQGRKPDIVKK